MLSVNLRSSLRVVLTGPTGLINRAGPLTSVSWIKLPLGPHTPLRTRGHGLYNFSDPMDKGSVGVSSGVVNRRLKATQITQVRKDFLPIFRQVKIAFSSSASSRGLRWYQIWLSVWNKL